METLYYTIGVCCVSVLLLYTWRILNWIWFRPKKLEKCLRRQGLDGNSYRFLYGDLKDFMSMISDFMSMIHKAKSKPINISDDIKPRIIPLYIKTLQEYGTFIWLGPNPSVIITDPELVKEILTKSDIYQKAQITNPLAKKIS